MGQRISGSEEEEWDADFLQLGTLTDSEEKKFWNG